MGLSEYVQPLDCVTVCVCPAMLMVAVRSGPVFAAVRKATVPLPDPLAPLVIVIQPCDGVAVQLQPDAVVTAIDVASPPAAGTVWAGGAIDTAHVPA